MKPKGSQLCSQKPATSPYPETDESRPHLPSIFPEDPFYYYHLPMHRSSMWSFPFRFTNQNFVYVSHFSYACYLPHPSHSPWLDHPNSIWWSVQLMKLIIQSSHPSNISLSLSPLNLIISCLKMFTILKLKNYINKGYPFSTNPSPHNE